jgi:hypothetical protein
VAVHTRALGGHQPCAASCVLEDLLSSKQLSLRTSRVMLNPTAR